MSEHTASGVGGSTPVGMGLPLAEGHRAGGRGRGRRHTEDFALVDFAQFIVLNGRAAERLGHRPRVVRRIERSRRDTLEELRHGTLERAQLSHARVEL